MARILTLTANPLLNLISPGRIEAGRVNRVAAQRAAAEGKGINVGKLLVAHGHEVVACGFAGGQAGAWFTALVAEAGLRTALTPTDANLRVGFMDAPADTHPTTILPGGFSVTAAESAACLATLATELADCELLIASGSVPDPDLREFYVAVLAAAAAAGVPAWLDSYGPAMQAALASPHPPAFCKPNRQEYEAGGDWDRAAEWHLSDGPTRLVARSAAGAWQVEPPAIEQRNPIGSGDCYVAALAHATLAGWEPRRRLAYAAAAGAANAARDEVAAIGPADIEALVSAARVSEMPA